MNQLNFMPDLTEAEARSLTDEVKTDAAKLWAKLLRLYEGGAHTALGYTSWGAYFEAEFGQSHMTGYRLLDAARVMNVLPGNTRVSQNGARALAPVLKQEGPEATADVWVSLVREFGPAPTT